MLETTLLLAGAVLGVAADRAADFAWQTYADVKRSRARLRNPKRSLATRAAVLQYFGARQRETVLYETRSIAVGSRLPILFDPTLPVTGTNVEAQGDTHVVVADHSRTSFQVDRRLIRRTQGRGATLWDGSLLYVTGADLPGPTLRIRAGVCSYFSYVTFSDKISRQARRKSSQILDSTYSDLQSVLSGATKPVVVAAATTCVFRNEHGETEVAIQRRSHAVFNGAGELAVIPVFGLEDNTHGGLASRFNVVFYNFVKEFIEEFYGLEELTRAATSPRIAPDWIFEIEPAKRLLAEHAAGRLELRLTGVGSDLTDGSLGLALLASFSSPEYLARLKLDCTASWESAGIVVGERPIKFVPLSDGDQDELDALVRSEGMYPSSLFSLDLARARGAHGK